MTRLASQQLTRLFLVDLEIQRGNTTAIQGKVKAAKTRMNGAKPFRMHDTHHECPTEPLSGGLKIQPVDTRFRLLLGRRAHLELPDLSNPPD